MALSKRPFMTSLLVSQPKRLLCFLLPFVQVKEEAFTAYAAGGVVDYTVAEAAAGVWGLLALGELGEDRGQEGRR